MPLDDRPGVGYNATVITVCQAWNRPFTRTVPGKGR